MALTISESFPQSSPTQASSLADILHSANGLLGDADSSLCVILNLPSEVETEVSSITELAERIRQRAAYINDNINSIRVRLGVSL